MSNIERIEPYLQATAFLDFDQPAVRAYAQEQAGKGSRREQAVSLYYAVRDGFRYDPYRLDMTVRGMSASTVLAQGFGWCVNKAVLLAALCRAIGIPARLGFADVRNHLSTQRMRDTMDTDIFYFHGYTEIVLDGKWRKATPAFNKELCEKFGLHTLEFDGETDSIYHPFDKSGQRHMEYVNFRGEFADLPLDTIIDVFDREYPGMIEAAQSANFDEDVAKETQAISQP